MLLNFGILLFVIGLGIMISENRNGVDRNSQASMSIDGKVRC